MRRIVPLFFFLGGFLMVAGIVAAVYAPGATKKTPLDVNTTIKLEGQGGKVNLATGKITPQPLQAVSVTKADSQRSDDKVVAFTNYSCLVIAKDDPADCVPGTDPRLVTASTDVFATNRVTARAVNDKAYLPADASPHEGVINKWPFGAEKKTYPYWDAVSKQAVDATYDRIEKLDGLESYVYKVTISGAPIQIGKGVNGTYDDVKEIYVDPATGAIVNQTEQQQRTLDDGTKALDLQLAFTAKQVAGNVEEAKANGSSLSLITKVVPIVGIIGGLLLLAVGGFLVMTRGRGQRTAN